MTRNSALLAALMLLASSSVSYAALPMCELTFRIGTSTPMFSASVFVSYAGAPGEFPGEGVDVDCQLLNGTLGSFGDADASSTLSLNAIGTPSPIQGPKDFVRCVWIPSSRFPVQGDFNLGAQSGSDTNFPIPNPVNPQITISKISCSGDVTTTTTTSSSTTSTTLVPPTMCGDFDGNGKIQTTDALGVLRAGVGQLVCLLCLCDVDGNGKNGASDALAVLRKAVGLSVDFQCSICP